MPTPDIWTESDLASGRAARQLIKFYWNPTTDEHHIELKQGGQERMVFDSQATEHYQQQYPDEWARYKANVDQSEGQIPLENVQWLDPAMVALLESQEHPHGEHPGRLERWRSHPNRTRHQKAEGQGCRYASGGRRRPSNTMPTN